MKFLGSVVVLLALLVFGIAGAQLTTDPRGGTVWFKGRLRTGPTKCNQLDAVGGNGDGTRTYCPDCQQTCPVQCGGTGADCVRENGVWNCCHGGGGGPTCGTTETCAPGTAAGTVDFGACALTCVPTGGDSILGWCPVTNYGAVPDDLNDDTVAIQAAIEDCNCSAQAPGNSACEGIVYFPKGVYRISDQLWAHGVNLLGDGVRGSIIEVTTPLGNCSVINGHRQCEAAILFEGVELPGSGSVPNSADCGDFTDCDVGGTENWMKDLCLHGPGAANPDLVFGTATADTDGIIFAKEYSDGVLVENVHVAKFDTAIDMSRTGIHLAHVAADANFYGVFAGGCLEAGAQNWHINDSTFQRNAMAAFGSRGCAPWSNLVMENVQVFDSPYAFYQEAVGTPDPVRAFFAGVTIDNLIVVDPGNGVFFTENAAVDGRVENLHINNLGIAGCGGSPGRFDNCGFDFIAAKAKDYAFVLGDLRGHNTFGIRNLQDASVQTPRGAVGVWSIQSVTGEATFRVQDPANESITVASATKKEHLRVCGPNNVCLPTFIPTLSGATPSVADAIAFFVTNGGATTVTNFTGGRAGQCIELVFTDANTTVSDAGNLKLNGSFASAADSSLTLCTYDGTNWVEMARSPVATGASAPVDATYLTETANGTLTNEFPMSALGTGLVRNTTATGVPSIYAGTMCPGQCVTSLDADGVASCAACSGGAAGYNQVDEEGTGLTPQTEVNFIGDPITCVNNGGASRTDCTVTAYATVQNEGSALTQRGTLDMKGTSVNCADNGGASKTECTVTAYNTVKDEGSVLTQRDTLKFTGAGVACSDTGGETVCNVAGGSGGTSDGLVVWPTGGIPTIVGSQTVGTTADVMRCWRYPFLLGKTGITHISWGIVTAMNNCGVAIYNDADAGSQITEIAATACTSSNQAAGATVSAFDLVAGTTDRVCFCNSGTTNGAYASTDMGSSTQAISNAISHTAAVYMGTAANPCVGGDPPATTGAITEVTGASAVEPPILFLQ